jgi:hypothetical protein
MRNIDVKDDEEPFVAVVLGLCDVLRQVESVDKRMAERLREDALQLMEKTKQKAWDGLPDKAKREVAERTRKQAARPETTHRPHAEPKTAK